MAEDFAYLNSVTNLKSIMDKIRNAGVPPKFTREFLHTSLGFTSSNDRGIISVLKALRMLDGSGVPTSRYNEYRGGQRGRAAIADGLRDGWASVFLANQHPQDLRSGELADLFRSVSGKGDAVAAKMATTFRALAEIADWSESAPSDPDATTPPQGDAGSEAPTFDASKTAQPPRLQLHHDIHLHLPATSDVAVYTAIFRAMKGELLG